MDRLPVSEIGSDIPPAAAAAEPPATKSLVTTGGSAEPSNDPSNKRLRPLRRLLTRLRNLFSRDHHGCGHTVDGSLCEDCEIWWSIR